MATLADRFYALFAGLDRAHGRYTLDGTKDAKGKANGRAVTEKTAPTPELWERHLAGTYGLGVVPIRIDATCRWGAIDVDVYRGFDHAALRRQVEERGLPLVVCRSKSGGGHLFLFLADDAPAELVRSKLTEWADALGYHGAEVFPKQTRLDDEGVGNWINMPYQAGDRTTRYAVGSDGAVLSAAEFLALAEAAAVTTEALAHIEPRRADPDDDDLWFEAPPCLVRLAERGFPEGDRNNGLFNVAVYLRKRHGDGWAERLDAYYQKFMRPPLGHREVAMIAKSVGKKGYNFKCHDRLIAAACDRATCLTREFGVGGGGKRLTQAEALLKIAGTADLFHTPAGDGYADFAVGGHRETWPIRSRAFRDWLVREFYALIRRPPASEAMQGALGATEARARFDSPEREVHFRVARAGDRLYLDLCDPGWRTVEVDADGWRIIGRPPVRFRRAKGMLALPDPERGGKIKSLRPFLNVASDDDFALSVGWVLGALSGRGPYAIMVIGGEQGTAKTSYARTLRDLIDPQVADPGALPRHDHDLYINANNAHVLAFDNISKLSDWLSDTLCRLATGGGFRVRALYTDTDEVIFEGTRPLILNGIENFIERPDLADRCTALTLDEITDERRRTKAALDAEFKAAHPKILGALLDAASHGLRELPRTSLARPPRMADFALWVAACEGALWEPGTFERAYAENQGGGQLDLIEADPVAAAVQTFMADTTTVKGDWEGTAAELLDSLINYTTEETRRNRRWPRAAGELRGRLRRAAPGLRRIGLEVEFFDRSHGSRKLALRRVPSGADRVPSGATETPEGVIGNSGRHPVNPAERRDNWKF